MIQTIYVLKTKQENGISIWKILKLLKSPKFIEKMSLWVFNQESWKKRRCAWTTGRLSKVVTCGRNVNALFSFPVFLFSFAFLVFLLYCLHFPFYFFLFLCSYQTIVLFFFPVKVIFYNFWDEVNEW